MDKDTEKTPSPSTNEGFVYEIIVDITCELFKTEPLRSQIPNFGEMSISSEWFNDHRDCQEDAAQILISLANRLREITGKRYVIATKMNPMHDEGSTENASFDPWEADMVLKMYLADAARLKHENVIDGSVVATVRASHHPSFNQHTQVSQ